MMFAFKSTLGAADMLLVVVTEEMAAGAATGTGAGSKVPNKS
jgi:hypothetical protein